MHSSKAVIADLPEKRSVPAYRDEPPIVVILIENGIDPACLTGVVRFQQVPFPVIGIADGNRGSGPMLRSFRKNFVNGIVGVGSNYPLPLNITTIDYFHLQLANQQDKTVALHHLPNIYRIRCL